MIRQSFGVGLRGWLKPQDRLPVQPLGCAHENDGNYQGEGQGGRILGQGGGVCARMCVIWERLSTVTHTHGWILCGLLIIVSTQWHTVTHQHHVQTAGSDSMAYLGIDTNATCPECGIKVETYSTDPSTCVSS